jgi:hypothetical protein
LNDGYSAKSVLCEYFYLGGGRRGGERGKRGKKLLISSILPLPDVHTSLESEETINTL